MTSLVEPRRSGGRTGRLSARKSTTSRAVWPGLEGGAYRPLSDRDVRRIHQSVLEVLSTIGMADATPDLVAIACERGCSVTEGGRLVFPAAIVEDILGSARREFTMYSRDGKNNVSVGGRRVYFATSGEAISIVDSETGAYRPSTLLDIYDCARLCDALDNIHQVGSALCRDGHRRSAGARCQHCLCAGRRNAQDQWDVDQQRGEPLRRDRAL
jgi:trimethylamine---corrinoid protein Co-methyltransferase